MPVYRGYQTDPALARAAANIAGLFAPPSGADAAGWAGAAATREKAARMADLYASAADPNGDRTVFDRRNIAVGNYNPTQSFYAQDQNNQTVIRGQDVTARTARENNLRDNARQFAVTRFGDISEGSIRPALPGSVAAMYGLPEAPAQTGVLRERQGEALRVPTEVMGQSERVMGPALPLTRDQVLGAALGALPLEQQQMLGMTGPGMQQIVGPDNQPRFAPNAQAVGQPAFNAPAAAARPLTGQAERNGRLEPTFWDPAINGFRYAQGEQTPVPGGVQVTQLPQPQGRQSELQGSVLGTVQRTASSAQAAENTLLKYAELVSAAPSNQGLGAAIQGNFQNFVQTAGELGQMFGSSQREVQKMIEENRFTPEALNRLGGFRTDIPAAQALRQIAILQVAEALSQDTQVSNKDVERAELLIGGGDLLSNQRDTLSRIAATLSVIRQRKADAERANPAAGRAFPGQPDRPVPQPGAAPAPAPGTEAAPRRLRFNPATGQVE
jgi:hypothetical protein